MPLSGAQIDKLGQRIRDGSGVSDDDRSLLQSLLVEHSGALETVGAGLRGLGLAPTTRLKTSGTIRDKLKREPRLTLRGIHDLAGARVVKRMTLDQQDELSGQIRELWPDAKSVDRRESPTFGYRAFHLIPRINGRWVEIQIRTFYQDTWAQVMEMFGDMWGRDVRYGGPPSNPDEPWAQMTRREVVDVWTTQSELIAKLETMENRRAQYPLDIGEAPVHLQDVLESLDTEIERAFGPLRESLRHIRETLDLR